MAFQRCGELPPGPTPDRRQSDNTKPDPTTPPNDRPHDPPDPPRDDCASWRFQSGVASSIQGPHPRQLAFPPHPCLAADRRVYLKPSRASRPAVRGQQPSHSGCHSYKRNRRRRSGYLFITVGKLSSAHRWVEDPTPRVSNSASSNPHTFDTLVIGMSGGRKLPS